MMEAQAVERKPLEDLLLGRGRISPDDLRKVRLLQQERGERIERLLLDLGFISEDDLISLHLRSTSGCRSSAGRSFRSAGRAAGRESPVPEAREDPAARDPGRHARGRDGRSRRTSTACRVSESRPASRVQRRASAARRRSSPPSKATTRGAEQAAEEGDGTLAYIGDDEEDVNHLRDLASEAPVIRLVNLLINRAVEQRASDIHIEPFENELKVRYRIDGVLHDIESPPRRLQAAIVSRVKIMAKLNIAERRLPQDGRIKLRTMGKEIDLRVSTLPTLYGESVVMRILDRSSIVLDLEQLGLPGRHARREFEKLIIRPYGMILVTGPTGSGKTTTLYGALDEDQLARQEDHHHRGPGRVSGQRRQPDPREAADRPHLRQRAALDRAPGSRRHHGR